MNVRSKKRQQDKILKRLRAGSVRLQRNFGMVHFSYLYKLAPQYNARIFELRQAGHYIVCHKVPSANNTSQSFYRLYE